MPIMTAESTWIIWDVHACVPICIMHHTWNVLYIHTSLDWNLFLPFKSSIDSDYRVAMPLPVQTALRDQ